MESNNTYPLQEESSNKKKWTKPELSELQIHLAGGDGPDLAAETSS